MSLVGVKAKNHRQQVGRRGADDSADDRRTPDDLWNAWNEKYRFTLDAAASAENAKVEKFFTLEQDALHLWWSGRVWCNPPYSDVGAWVRHAWAQMKNKDCELIVMLVPANRTEQGWWQDHIEPRRGGRDYPDGITLRVEFLRGRIRFGRPGWTKPAKGDRPPFGLALLIWEKE